MNLGIAFDIGTTTVIGALVNLDRRERLKTLSHSNPQTRFGRDVLSRIEAIRRDEGKLDLLHRLIIDAANGMIERLLEGVGGCDSIVRGCIAGNPVMEHILLNVSPVSIGRTPYKPVFKEGRMVKGGEIGLITRDDAEIYIFPLIGGFVGGDTVAYMLSVGIYRLEDIALAIDIGTNTEIVLKTSEGIYVTSAPAGPALEGEGIRDGMMAGEGAIEGVDIDGEGIRLSVIGGGRPRGICGSGIIDAVSQMLKAGVIDPDGRLVSRDELESNLANRVMEEERGNRFILYRDARGEIAITQDDVREVQLAKGSIQAGIKVLLRRRGVAIEDVSRVFITGAFGSHLSIDSLITMDMIPPVWENRIEFVDNAPLLGAEEALLDESAVALSEEIASGAHYSPLSGSPAFEREFLRGMGFMDKSFWKEEHV